MSVQVFDLDRDKKSLTPLRQKPMKEIEATEPYDLEPWLASTGDRLFGRRILWISRQDQLSEEQRSDLLGLDKEGNLLIAELKRGELNESGVAQALAYAADYAKKTADELVDLFSDQSEKSSGTQLVHKADSPEDAQKRIVEHVGTVNELNQAQILLLVAEDFSAKALAICDYLNE